MIIRDERKGAALPLRDTALRYGAITRALHWTMAAMLALQFVSAALRALWRDGPLYGLIWPTHTQIGFAILVLALLRGGWGLFNLARRPEQGKGLLGRAAALGHLVLYGFMVTVPALALLRSFGSGNGYSFLGVPVLPRRENEIAALTELGNSFHGLAGWLFLAVVVGHTAMALYHLVVARDGRWERMNSASTVR